MTKVPARIGFLVKTFPRLSETFILNEILGLQRMGWTLQIYSLKRPVEEPVHPGVAQVRTVVRYVPSLRPAASWMEPVKALAAHAGLLVKRPARYVAALWKYFSGTRAARVKEFVQAGWLAADLEREGITHLHAHFANAPTAVAEIVHWMTGIPFSFTAHAKDIYTTNEVDLARRMATATATLTCTAFNARHLHGIAGERAQVELAYHGIDTERFQAKVETHGAPEKAEIPTVLTVGRFSEKKGLEDLIHACALLRDRGVRFRCVMVGYGALEDRLKELRGALRLNGLIEMPGRLAQPEVIAQYRRAAVFALPCVVLENGDRDGIPNVLLESMAAGVPVVTTDVSGIAEVVENGRTGWLVQPHNPAMLADAIAYVLSHGTEAACVASLARERVEAEFSLAASARRAHDALRRAVMCGAAKGWNAEGATVLQGEPNA
jgi:glycosyltransferase involved in cell wall biosynthesis